MKSDTVKRDYIDGRFGQVHVYHASPEIDRGKTPLLCIHLTPLAAVIYTNFLREMGHDRLAIAIDTPGYGNSDPPPTAPSLADYAAAIGDVLDAFELDQVDVMGFHTGSKISLELARQQPQRVHRMVLVSIAFWTAAERADRKMSIRAPDINDSGEHLTELWQEIARWSTPGRSAEMIAETFYASQLQPEISHWGYQAAWPYDVEQAVAEIEQDTPLMVLNPEDDLCGQAPRIKSLLKNSASKFVDLPGWGHGFLDLKTAETAELVRKFLDGDQGNDAL